MRNVLDDRCDDREDEMKFISMQHMPLTSAYLCQDCNCVGNNAMQCPACASTALMGLAAILNREEEVHMSVTSARILVQALAA
jgi:RNA polymerase subunit RPABC4/transcription elongation factor Spt4